MDTKPARSDPQRTRMTGWRPWALLVAAWAVALPVLAFLSVKLQDLIGTIAARWSH